MGIKLKITCNFTLNSVCVFCFFVFFVFAREFECADGHSWMRRRRFSPLQHLFSPHKAVTFPQAMLAAVLPQRCGSAPSVNTLCILCPDVIQYMHTHTHKHPMTQRPRAESGWLKCPIGATRQGGSVTRVQLLTSEVHPGLETLPYAARRTVFPSNLVNDTVISPGTQVVVLTYKNNKGQCWYKATQMRPDMEQQWHFQSDVRQGDKRAVDGKIREGSLCNAEWYLCAIS